MRPEEVANRFRDARKRAGLTQAQASRALTVHPSTISMWETGAREPDFVTIFKMASLYGVPAAWFFGGALKTEWQF